MSRTRTTILNDLDEMYREAFDRAKATGDQTQMATLDFAYRREQLYFEILLDVRDQLQRLQPVRLDRAAPPPMNRGWARRGFTRAQRVPINDILDWR